MAASKSRSNALSPEASDNPVLALLRASSPQRPAAVNDEALIRSDELYASACSMDDQLYESVALNDAPQVHNLFRRGASPNQDDIDGNSVLQIAAGASLPEISNMLMKAGADLETQVGDLHVTPLVAAASSGHTEAARALIKLGANVDSCDSEGRTALHHAAILNKTRLALELVKRGAIVNSRASDGRSPILVRFGANLDGVDEDGDTPLLTACSFGFIDCVQQLLACGADRSCVTRVWVPIPQTFPLSHILPVFRMETQLCT